MTEPTNKPITPSGKQLWEQATPGGEIRDFILAIENDARGTPTPDPLDVERLRKAFTGAVNAPSVISHGGPAVLHYQDVDRIWTAILAALDAKVKELP